MYPWPFAYFNKGRTVTHEAGHWLNLYHPWGNVPPDQSGVYICGDDSVADTPIQQGPDFGDTSTGNCPSYPTGTCGTPCGDMFMNHMQWCTDKCETTFSKGQATRLYAALNVLRPSIITSKTTSCISTGVSNLTTLENSIDVYPNPTNAELFINLNLVKVNNLIVSVTNIVGQEVFKTILDNYQQGNLKLDLSGQVNGIYFITIKSSDEIVTRKIVLSR